MLTGKCVCTYAYTHTPTYLHMCFLHSQKNYLELPTVELPNTKWFMLYLPFKILKIKSKQDKIILSKFLVSDGKNICFLRDMN